MLTEYRKSAVAIIGAIITILAVWGVEVDPQLVAAITTLVTAGLVWLIPNDAAVEFDAQDREQV